MCFPPTRTRDERRRARYGSRVTGVPHERIERADDLRVADYRGVRDREWLLRRGLFVAESRTLVRRLLERPSLCTLSVLVTPAARAALEHELAARAGDFPVYEVAPRLLEQILGFEQQQGCVALGARPTSPKIAELVAAEAGAPESASSAFEGPRIWLAAERLGNPDNVGGLFRNALALGARGVALGAASAHPYYRKSLRTSMGAIFGVPWGWVERWPQGLEAFRSAGYELLALTPSGDAVDLASLGPEGARCERAVLLLGEEGAGLGAATLAWADRRVRIPMAPGADSLNVATAAAIALHWLRASASPVPCRARP